MPREESRKPLHHLGPSRCDARKAVLCSFEAAQVTSLHGQVTSLTLRPTTCPTEAHTSAVAIPPQGPLLSLSRSWQQDTETALIMLQSDLKYPPRKLPSHVPTVRNQDSILQGVRRR
jgi:hypothetical protein